MAKRMSMKNNISNNKGFRKRKIWHRIKERQKILISKIKLLENLERKKSRKKEWNKTKKFAHRRFNLSWKLMVKLDKIS